MDEKNKTSTHEPHIIDLLERLKEMPQRLERQKREYYERKAFVEKVFKKAVEQALGSEVAKSEREEK